MLSAGMVMVFWTDSVAISSAAAEVWKRAESVSTNSLPSGSTSTVRCTASDIALPWATTVSACGPTAVTRTSKCTASTWPGSSGIVTLGPFTNSSQSASWAWSVTVCGMSR